MPVLGLPFKDMKGGQITQLAEFGGQRSEDGRQEYIKVIG
jgi:hypothetical protein